MVKAPWTIEISDLPSMSNPELDAEHEHFIALVNELNRAISSGNRDKAEIFGILELILEDTVSHFAHEDQLFAELSYPYAQQHGRSHAQLIKYFQRSLEAIRKNNFDRQWIEMGLNIKNALVNHVLEEDGKYVNYLRCA